MATIPLSQGTTGTLTFNNTAVSIDPSRVSSVTWALPNTGGGALSFTAPNQLMANAIGVGKVQATAALVNPTESKIYECWVEVTPAPSAGNVPLTSPINVTSTVAVVPPTIPPSLHRIQPVKIKTAVSGTVLKCVGVRFTSACKIIFDGAEIATTFTSVTELSCTVPLSATEKIVPVLVRLGTTDTTTLNFEYKN